MCDCFDGATSPQELGKRIASDFYYSFNSLHLTGHLSLTSITTVARNLRNKKNNNKTFPGFRALSSYCVLKHTDWPFTVPRSVISGGHCGRRSGLAIILVQACLWTLSSESVNEQRRSSKARARGPQTAAFE